MKILIATDKYKGSLSAWKITQALTRGIRSHSSSHTIIPHPLADGGDGTLLVLEQHLALERINLETLDPIGRTINSFYLSDGISAYIELANSSGMALLNRAELDPLNSNTVGTGLLIKDALTKNHQQIFLSIGGSASTDGGTGILAALGYSFLDVNNKAINPCGATLIDIQQVLPPKNKIKTAISILSDVQNTLLGSRGSAMIYGPQKGATPEDIMMLEAGLKHLTEVMYTLTGSRIEELEGGGAAGGVAAGLSAFLNVKIINGFKFISELTNLNHKVEQTEIIITGEGRLDHSSVDGKVVGEIIKLAHQNQKKLIMVVGQTDPKLKISVGIEIYELMNLVDNETEAIEKAEELLVGIGRKIGAGLEGMEED